MSRNHMILLLLWALCHRILYYVWKMDTGRFFVDFPSSAGRFSPVLFLSEVLYFDKSSPAWEYFGELAAFLGPCQLQFASSNFLRV